MTPAEVKQLKGGELIQCEDPRYPAIGVIVDPRMYTTKRNHTEDVRVQWIGGGCQISVPEYHGWNKLRVIPANSLDVST